MHRVVVFLLVPALIAMSGVVPALHTHAYDDHDHPEHHHLLAIHHHDLLAIHHHDTPRGRRDDGAAHLEGCDPGAHIVSVTFVGAAPAPMHLVAAGLEAVRIPDPEVRAGGTVSRADVRVHGPPPRADASPRAPPLIAHA